jgi:hypothetical protein
LPQGGAISWQSSNTLTMTNCTVHDNNATADGGGLFVTAGTVLLQNGTSFFDNSAAGVGNNVQVQGGTVYYTFPVPPGHWLPNSECRVYRRPCPSGSEGEACLASFDKCSLVPDSSTSSDHTHQTASIPRSDCTGPHTSRCGDPQPCSPRSFIQPCDWNSTHEVCSPTHQPRSTHSLSASPSTTTSLTPVPPESSGQMMCSTSSQQSAEAHVRQDSTSIARPKPLHRHSIATR